MGLLTRTPGWTVENAPDQRGRTIAVTGANGGLGFEAARGLAERGAHVVLACRSVERGTDAADRIARDTPDATLDVLELDLADLDSVERFAETVRERYDELDALVNNAGVMAVPRRETADGFEQQFGVNHLGHFALTGRLLDSIRAADDPRVVTVTSGMHRMGAIPFDDPHWEQSYDRWQAYAASKLANMLFALELDRRFGEQLRSTAAHPGYASTDLQLRGPRMEGSRVRALAMRAANRLVGQSPEQGALPILYAATAPTAESGALYGPDGIAELRGSPTHVEPADRALDEETAERLWTLSEELTGVTFG